MIECIKSLGKIYICSVSLSTYIFIFFYLTQASYRKRELSLDINLFTTWNMFIDGFLKIFFIVYCIIFTFLKTLRSLYARSYILVKFIFFDYSCRINLKIKLITIDLSLQNLNFVLYFLYIIYVLCI